MTQLDLTTSRQRKLKPDHGPQDHPQDHDPQHDGQQIERDVKITRHQLQLRPSPNRQTLIAEAAYCRAEARGFSPGHELDDWLAAEADVDARMQHEVRA